MDRIKRDTLLGLVFFGGLGLLLWATINLTDLSLTQIDPLKVYFRDAGGVRVGDPVLVLGKRIGKVEVVDYLKERRRNRILLQLRMEEEIPLFEDYTIEIQESSALGGRQVQIDPGVGNARRQGEELTGKTASNAIAALGDIGEGEGPIGENLEQLLLEMRSFFRNLNDPDTSIGALVTRRELYDEWLRLSVSLKRTIEAVERSDGLLGRIINDRTLSDDVSRMITNLAAVTDKLRGTDGLLGRIVNDSVMADDVAQTVADLRTIVANARGGKGALGRILSDEEMAQNLADAVAELAALTRAANDPDSGLLGALLRDPELRDFLKNALANVEDITEKVNTGDGLLAVLINDEDLGERVNQLFGQVSRAIEDAREAAPIGTFFQVLSGAF